MKNNKLTWAVVTSIAAGMAIYLIMKRRREAEDEKPVRAPGEKHLTNVFAKAKNYGGGEFVL